MLHGLEYLFHAYGLVCEVIMSRTRCCVQIRMCDEDGRVRTNQPPEKMTLHILSPVASLRFVLTFESDVIRADSHRVIKVAGYVSAWLGRIWAAPTHNVHPRYMHIQYIHAETSPTPHRCSVAGHFVRVYVWGGKHTALTMHCRRSFCLSLSPSFQHFEACHALPWLFTPHFLSSPSYFILWFRSCDCSFSVFSLQFISPLFRRFSYPSHPPFVELLSASVSML